MTSITHHIPEDLLIAYASGNLAPAFALAVATHVSMCDECRARLGAHEELGGALIEDEEEAEVSGDMKARVFDALDAPVAREIPF